MRSRNTGLILLLTASAACWACGGRLESPPAALAAPVSPSRDFTAKVAALKDLTLTNAITLKADHTIKKGDGAGFIFPSSFVVDRDGAVLIADNNGHAIHRWSTREGRTTALVSSTSEDSLQFPTTIQEVGGKLYVGDNDGIKIFKQNGHFESLLRTYYALCDFVVADNRSIYANPEFRNVKQTDPLIVKLGPNGERVSGFGRRVNNPKFKGFDDRAFLARSGQSLVAAFIHRPQVAVFDLSREQLVREFPVNHSVFEALLRLAQDEKITNPTPSQVVLPRYIAAVATLDDSIFVLLHLPHIEIVEFSFDGVEKRRFRSTETAEARDYFGMEVRRESASLKFFVGVSGTSDTNEIPFITQFSIADADLASMEKRSSR